MLGEQRMLVRSDMLRLEKDIGDNNPVALRRHYGILVVWAQSDKLVVSRNQVTRPCTYQLNLGQGVVPEPSDQISPFLYFPSMIMVALSHISGMIWIGMTSPT